MRSSAVVAARLRDKSGDDALFRYYQRLPGNGSSSSSSGITPSVLHVGSNVEFNTSQSSVPCTDSLPCTESLKYASCSQSHGMSVCEQPRKRKGASVQTQRRRSNPAVALINLDAPVEPVPVPSNSFYEIIELSSDRSASTIKYSSAGSSRSASTVDAANATTAAARTRKGKSPLPVIEEADEYSEEEFVPTTTKLPKKNYDAQRKFQDTWAARLPWAEISRGSDGLFEYVKCTVCSEITGKAKILAPNWDTLTKHGGKRKATRNMPNGIKKGQWFIANNCKHLRYERIYAGRNHVTIAQQLSVVKGCESTEGSHPKALKKTAPKIAHPILSIQWPGEQASIFKLAMMGNANAAMQGDVPVNPLTKLWRRIEANALLRNKLSEYMKIVELAVVTVLGSVEDERTFSTFNFMKNRLRNRLSTHLPLVVGMHAQDFYGLSDFPYDAAYDEWKSSTRKED